MHNRPVIGEVFGKLTLIGPAPPSQYSAGKVICECECGSLKTYLLSNLMNGSTKSCGCSKTKAAAMKRVRDADTGKEWDSLTEFAAEYGVAVSSVTQAIKRKGKVAGIRLEVAEKRPAPDQRETSIPRRVYLLRLDETDCEVYLTRQLAEDRIDQLNINRSDGIAWIQAVELRQAVPDSQPAYQTFREETPGTHTTTCRY